MSYRKITVDGKEYEYTIGKTHTKIKGINVFQNKDIGHVKTFDVICECCGETFEALYPNRKGNTVDKIVVTPHDIMKKIRIPTPSDTYKVLVNGPKR